jgi:hypothetical protein
MTNLFCRVATVVLAAVAATVHADPLRMVADEYTHLGRARPRERECCVRAARFDGRLPPGSASERGSREALTP